MVWAEGAGLRIITAPEMIQVTTWYAGLCKLWSVLNKLVFHACWLQNEVSSRARCEVCIATAVSRLGERLPLYTTFHIWGSE